MIEIENGLVSFPEMFIEISLIKGAHINRSMTNESCSLVLTLDNSSIRTVYYDSIEDAKIDYAKLLQTVRTRKTVDLT